jgi:eukaryotic-like serine/threonine-protein kinase
MGASRVRLLVASILVAVTVRPAASDSCAESERDERGRCPAKVAKPPSPPPAKKTELDIQGPDVMGARVVLDGETAGYAPLILETRPGRHRIELHKGGFEPYSEWIVAKQAQRVAVVAKLRPAASPVALAVKPGRGSCPQGMIHVPAAKLQKGDPGGAGSGRREVALAGYCIDKTEVTVKAYAACVAAKGCAARPRTAAFLDKEVQQRASWFCNQDDRPDHPVSCVDWDDAVAYCKWEGKRLPTMEEWLYAAQGPDGRPYPWGNDPPGPRRLNACGTECVGAAKRIWDKDCSAIYNASDGWEITAPVGSFPGGASPFGVLDMAGNVGEWTILRNDDHGKSWKDGHHSSLCGGGWLDNNDKDVKVESCSWSSIESRSPALGFRCARGE